MTTNTTPPPGGQMARRPGGKLLRRLNIGRKLTLGFGILVLLTLIMIGLSYLGSERATGEIDRANLRAPVALAATRAQASLLRMVGDVRGYLALGDKQFRDDYIESQQIFERNLQELREKARTIEPPIEGLDALQARYDAWKQVPPTLFGLHDDQLRREPALGMLIKDGSPPIVKVSQNIKRLIDRRATGPQTAEEIALIKDLASFQSSFQAMIAGLRGYVTTQRTAFYTEYIMNSIINDETWQRLAGARDRLPASQQMLLDEIGVGRKQLLPLADQIIGMAAGPHVREDLYQFREQTVLPADEMIRQLSVIATQQQDLLATDLARGNAELRWARQQTLIGGAVIALIALALAIIFRENIAGPVRRLTQVAEQIYGGDLTVQAQVESRDEIGRLATTFNRMTGQLRQSLVQVRHEKKRADDLLDVVIPIGVALSSEKNFNRLLENVVLEAKAFCNANAGILYLRTDDDSLRYVIVRDDKRQQALGGTTGNPMPFAPLPLYDPESGAPNDRNIAVHTALSGESVNIARADDAVAFDFEAAQDFDVDAGFPSLLTIPLKNAAGQAIGVLQLLEALDPQSGRIIPFDTNLQRMIESLSSLAVAALEAYIREQSLRQEIQQL
ncbi:MAG TPA: HAMP domain-containing protein, partial [Roseiflexaceae bacterium]|nr:HAMP domain-containing protein [Roseiflexaceae bacterium]